MVSEYNPADLLPFELRQKYETALASVFRHENGSQFPLLTPNLRESVLDHTQAMLAMVDNTERRYPTLAECFNLIAVKKMIYLHDAPEIVVGDFSRSSPDYEKLKPKRSRKEQLALSIILVPHLPYEFQQQAIDLFKRYEKPDTMDREAHFVKFLDMAQGNAFNILHAWNYLKSDKPIPPLLGPHIEKSIKWLLERGKNVLVALDEVEVTGREQMRDFISLELSRFGDIGYQKYIGKLIKELYS